MTNPEHYQGNAERSHELEQAAAERAAELREKEPAAERHQEHTAEKLAAEARAEAHEHAKKSEEYRPQGESKKSARSSFVDAKTREKSYQHTMRTIQKELPAPSRVFSQFIHNKTVERVSDVAGSTIARPNAILSGSLCALIIVSVLYVTARYFGFALSGFETIAAFVVGWVLGIIFDFLRVMLTGKR